jgi:hypothetical protein
MVASGGQPGQVPASVFCHAQTSPPWRLSAIDGEEDSSGGDWTTAPLSSGVGS